MNQLVQWYLITLSSIRCESIDPESRRVGRSMGNSEATKLGGSGSILHVCIVVVSMRKDMKKIQVCNDQHGTGKQEKIFKDRSF